VFGPGSRAEVAIVGELPVGNGPPVRVFGQIDRLVSGPDGMMIVDFKTDRIVPDRVRETYATQLALYRAVLSRMSPGVPIRAAILWTSAPRLDEVDPAELDGLVTRLVTNMGTEAAAGRP
jgi:ATP-dependent helicase/nuclease subunit A